MEGFNAAVMANILMMNDIRELIFNSMFNII